MELGKIYIERKSWTDKNGEVREYQNYYIYVNNEYNIPSLKVYIELDKQVIQMLSSVGALYEESIK